MTFSPFFLPSRARPTGLSFEIRPSAGLASAEPTIVNVSLPSPLSTDDGRADLDVVGRVVLVDDRGVLDQRLERLDPALDERLLVLGVLVLGVLGQVAVLLGVVDPIGDLGSLDGDHLVELRAELLETFA